MIFFVTAMAMPKTAWAQSYDTNGFGVDGANQPAVKTTDKYDINGDGVNDKVYEIGNAGQLYWFAALVNGTNGLTQNLGANAILTDNIKINDNVLVNGLGAFDRAHALSYVMSPFQSYTASSLQSSYLLFNNVKYHFEKIKNMQI